MTDDKELNARLRDFEKVTVGDARDAADRIEALTKERDAYARKLMQANNTYTEMHLEIERLSDKLATCEKYRDAYDEMGRIGTQAVRDLEAKLAKAVEALEALIHLAHDCEKELTEDLHHMDFCGESEPLTKARATLAEIKLQSSEFATQKGESHE